MDQPTTACSFAGRPLERDALRDAVAADCRRPEPDCVADLLPLARLRPEHEARAAALATRLVEALRAKRRVGLVEAMVQEFTLSSTEGVALMCLAEALLRIPDAATRDALIRDKIGRGDWRRHLGRSRPLFASAASWGLLLTGKLVSAPDEATLAAALSRLLARAGEPIVRRSVDLAMRMMGGQFVAGRSIGEAISRARGPESRGFRFSYDMLGEAAMTAADAERYRHDYEAAIEAIGAAAAGRGVHDRPGISVKLSALHPRYCRAQRDRVMAELLPRLAALAVAAKRHCIGFNIDAEEADRLELSLDLLEALCRDARLDGWDGLGFVIQAYQRRALATTRLVVALARRGRRRLMVRLVKGAYWDSEIKRAQLDGLADFPVFTRKPHTDVSYLACARVLLDAPDAVFPQFATHNARSLAAIHTMADPDAWTPEQYEFQCLHGMGEALYEEVVGPARLDRPCRVYAPVGTHETLLAYLVRRLLENGANSSFVNRVNDPTAPVSALVADPVALVAAEEQAGRPHPAIASPPALYGASRRNAAGLDLADETVLAALSPMLAAKATHVAGPVLAREVPPGLSRPVHNPADAGWIVGHVAEADDAAVEVALAAAACSDWGRTAPASRAAILVRAAALLEARMTSLLGLIVREAGKTLPNAVGEVREAVDFLRYYAAEAAKFGPAHRPLGPVAAISPWNFPLAIFVGQISAALAAGNPVLAKPAEQTPLIAHRAVLALHEAGVPRDALQFLPGDGAVGAKLVEDRRVEGVLFTGSNVVAAGIARRLAGRLGASGRPVPLIAETGGINAMMVDSSALPEQAVADVLASAFDSAGQRCSALRLLCVQAEIAPGLIGMLQGAMAELTVGDPMRLSTDIGPVVSEEARRTIAAHVDAMAARGHAVHAHALRRGCAGGHFVVPTLIEVEAVGQVEREVFGPVLHVLRYEREAFDAVLRDIAALGYGLTFGVHSRIDETVRRALSLAPAGNLYVNRSTIGATVGVQPFGGHLLSGTGPKAGGPLYLRRLLAACPEAPDLPPVPVPAEAAALLAWLGDTALAARCRAQVASCRAGLDLALDGPVGEANAYSLGARGTVLCRAATTDGLVLQLAACLGTGNRVRLPSDSAVPLPSPLPDRVRARLAHEAAPDAVLFEGEPTALLRYLAETASSDGPIRPVLVPDPGGLYRTDMLLRERSVSTNTAASGGNAGLLSL